MMPENDRQPDAVNRADRARDAGGRRVTGEIPGLYVLKFICALFVVNLHFQSFLRDLMLPAMRIAMPVFFCITGYFLLDGQSRISERKVLRMIIKIVILYVFALLIYLSFIACRTWFGDSGHDGFMTRIFSAEGYRNLRYSAHHLWYLDALILSLCVIYAFSKLKVVKLLYLLIPFGTILYLLMNNYRFCLPESLSALSLPSTVTNVICFGLPYIMTGTLLRIFEHKLPCKKTAWRLFIVLLLLSGIEYVLLPRISGDTYIFTLPLMAIAFVVFKNMEIKSKPGLLLAEYGKLYSTDIYILHMLAGMIILPVAVYLTYTIFGISGIKSIEAFVVFIATFLFAVCVRKLWKYHKNLFVNKKI
ncbi:MAG: acyltransferase family protein [Muribaculaceae bacterium]